MNIRKTLTNDHPHDHHQQRDQLERQVASLREAVGQRAAIADNLEVHFWLLSPSGDLGISLVWHNLSPPHPTPPRLFGLSVEILFKVN